MNLYWNGAVCEVCEMPINHTLPCGHSVHLNCQGQHNCDEKKGVVRCKCGNPATRWYGVYGDNKPHCENCQ